MSVFKTQKTCLDAYPGDVVPADKATWDVWNRNGIQVGALPPSMARAIMAEHHPGCRAYWPLAAQGQSDATQDFYDCVTATTITADRTILDEATGNVQTDSPNVGDLTGERYTSLASDLVAIFLTPAWAGAGMALGDSFNGGAPNVGMWGNTGPKWGVSHGPSWSDSMPIPAGDYVALAIRVELGVTDFYAVDNTGTVATFSGGSATTVAQAMSGVVAHNLYNGYGMYIFEDAIANLPSDAEIDDILAWHMARLAVRDYNICPYFMGR